MIKGSQRKIILINGAESSPFETAYFVLRSSAEDSGAAHADMVREANRIIELSVPEASRRFRRREAFLARLRAAALFFGGTLTGGSLVALLLTR
ncbi:MAG: hypothetical protein E7640_00165 [Ruminococcaceae bacterium]|nr:hypothetical protein [Oscillospiraceae bacterium]